MPKFKVGDIIDGANHPVLKTAKYKNGLVVAVDSGNIVVVRFRGDPHATHTGSARSAADDYPQHTRPGTHLLRVYTDYLTHATGFDQVAQIKHRASQRSISDLTL